MTVAKLSTTLALLLMAQVASARTTICHMPPGNPGNAHTLGIGDGGVADHLAHGDCLGACPCDACPDDPAKTEPGICGCGFTETVTNANGVGCTLCVVSNAGDSCALACLPPAVCLCDDSPGCCDANPCCDDCPLPHPASCDVSTCSCEPASCCFTACPGQ